MDKKTDEEIEKVLKGFIAEMHKWELNCAKMDDELEQKDSKLDEDEVEKANEKRISEIFAKYCTLKERKHGRLGMYQRPPAYNPNEEILEIKYLKPKKAEVYTQAHSGFGHKNKYTLFYKNDQWLIDYKEYYSAYEEKWVKAVL